MFKNLSTSLLYFFAILLLSNLILTIFNYFNIISNSIIKLLIPIISISISSFILGKKAKEKGYLEGLKLGALILLIFILITILLKEITIKSIIYYLILLLLSTLSSMIGINKKTSNL